METKGAKPFPKSPIYCFLNHSAERIPIFYTHQISLLAKVS
ncbi:MAG: hypothetical protein ACR5K5_05885 [Wolbachia sp.]